MEKYAYVKASPVPNGKFDYPSPYAMYTLDDIWNWLEESLILITLAILKASNQLSKNKQDLDFIVVTVLKKRDVGAVRQQS